MKVYICDICESIIKKPFDRKIVKIRKNTPYLDGRTGFTLEAFVNNKYTLCPKCYKRAVDFIKKGVSRMKIRTREGIEIYCLPDNARCSICNKNPEEMDECPIKNFDDLGLECVPELCEEYTEGEQ